MLDSVLTSKGDMEHLTRKEFKHWVAHGRTGGSIGCSWWIYETIELHCVTWLIEESQSCTCRWILTAIKYRSCSPAPLSCTPNPLEPSMYMKLSFQWFTFSVGGNRLGASCLRLCRKVGKYRETFFPSVFFFFLTVIKVQNILQSYDCSTEGSTLPFCIKN